MTRLRRLTILLATSGIVFSLAAQQPSRFGRSDPEDRPSAGRLVRGVKSPEPDRDDPTLRREAMLAWYGGKWTPEYRRFLMEVAAQEKARWASLLPGGPIEPAKVPGNHWTNIGPTNADKEFNGVTLFVRDSGRPVSIIVDPANQNIIYNATSGGGVWKTTDGGTTWAPLSETIGSLSDGTLAMDPSDHLTLYLGLGDAFDGTGIGLVKSTDGGATWSAPVFLGSSTTIKTIGVSPSDPSVVLAGSNAGLYRSTNGGTSFSPITLGSTVSPFCWSLVNTGGTNWVISVTTGNDSTSGSWNGVKLFYSSDDGATWTAPTGFASSGGRTTLAAAPSDPLQVYAMVASDTDTTGKDLQQFYRSADRGHNWTSLGLATNKQFDNRNFETRYVNNLFRGQGWYNQLFLVDPASSTTLWAGGALLLCKITGATTTPVYTQMSNWLAQFSLPYIHADFHAGAFDSAGCQATRKLTH